MTAQNGFPGFGAAAPPTVRLLPVPPSAPAAERWPTVPVDRRVSVNQPPLPWLAEDRLVDQLADQLTGRHSRTGAVRIVRFGDSWAGPLPDVLPDPGVWSANLAVGLAEVLRGARPIGQLNRWLSPAALAQLTVLAASRSAARRPAPSRRAPPSHPAPLGPAPATLQSVHLQRSGPDAVEAVALFGDTGSALSALAFRLEAFGDRWSCTALETRPTVSRRA
jgi:hypothetical protein